LDDQLARTKDGDIKFLEPGEYTVSVKKDGYFSWSKRLTVKENQVTWASPVPNALHLFLKDQPTQDLHAGVDDFQFLGSRLAVAASGTLIIAPLDRPNEAETAALPKPVKRMIVSPNQETIILTGDAAAGSAPAVLAYSARTKQVSDISSLFSVQPDLQFSGNNTLFDLEAGRLYAVNPAARTKKQVLDGVKAYALMQNNLYFVRAAASGTVLFVSGEDGKNAQELSAGLPDFRAGSLFVNYEKQVFLLADQSLYKINAAAEKVADNVTDTYFDPNNSTFMFIHGGEVSNYNFASQRVDFVTRSSDAVKNPVLQQNMSFAFMAKGNNITGLELDLRDRQNEYAFYQGTNLQKFLLDSDAGHLYILDDGELKSVKIR
jgi:hypothetical protein